MGIDKNLMKFNKILILMLCFIICINIVSAETDISVLDRLNNLGGSTSDYFRSVVESGDYYIAVGSSGSDLSGLPGGNDTAGSTDFVIAKFSKSDLSLVSLNNLGGSTYDEFHSVVESGDYYIAVGFSQSDLSGLPGGDVSAGYDDFVIAKFNKSDLSLVSINNLGEDVYDRFYSVIDSGDYYVAVGFSFRDFVIAKFNKSDLSLVTINNFGGGGINHFESVIDSGDYYVTVGYSGVDLSSLGGSSNAGGYDFVIAKFSKSDLSLVNINNLGGTAHDYFYSVIDSGDYYIAVGDSVSNLSGLTGGSDPAGPTDFVIAKFSKSDLSLNSINNLGGTSYDKFYSVVDSSDSYVAIGHSRSDLSSFSGGSNYTSSGYYDFVIAKFNKSDLSLLNLNNPGGSGSENLYSFINDSDGYYVAVGSSSSDLSSFPGGNTNTVGADFVIAKFGEGSLSPISTTFTSINAAFAPTNSRIRSGKFHEPERF